LNNKQRITLLSFLAYFAMSGMLAPMGIISSPLAEHFGQPVTEITARFGWLTMGILAGAIVALVVFDWIKLRTLMAGLYVLISASLLSLMLVENLTAIGFALGVVGFCCGIGLPGAALIISRSYETERRASMLVITDGSFSVAGIVCSWLAIFLLARNAHWSGAYQFVAVIAAIIVVLTLASSLPQSTAEDAIGRRQQSAWPAGVWMCLGALFLYTLGQWCFLLWLPNYAETELGVTREHAGRLVSQFWTGMFAAQLFVAWWVLRVGVRRLMLIAAFSTTALSLPLWNYSGIDGLTLLSTVWGFANLGLLKVTLSFATQLVAVPSARLVSSLLLGATVGTAISPRVTSWIVDATSTHFILLAGSIAYGAMTILLVFAVHFSSVNSIPAGGQSETI
jgi:TsgA-like MFS transporter